MIEQREQVGRREGPGHAGLEERIEERWLERDNVVTKGYFNYENQVGDALVDENQ